MRISFLCLRKLRSRYFAAIFRKFTVIMQFISEVLFVFIIFFRTIILYITVLVTIRIMGKSELSKMSPFQLVIVFMIAELASIPIESPDVSIIKGMCAIFTLLFLEVFISYVSIKSEGFKNFVNGKPSVLIEKGKINYKELRSLRISINDLMEQLRLGNSPSLSDVDYAVMESNGDLSIIPKPGKRPLTPDDMQITASGDAMPLVIISDGHLYSANLKKMGYDENKLKSTLLSYNIKSYDEVFMAFCDENRAIHVYCEKENGKAEEVSK